MNDQRSLTDEQKTKITVTAIEAGASVLTLLIPLIFKLFDDFKK